MEIAKIKEQLSIGQVLQHYQLKPNSRNKSGTGSTYMLNCPFHPDKTPSLQVYSQTNTVYCFSGNCKTHGRSLDVIDFIMHKDNLSKHEAILKAKELTGHTAPATKTAPEVLSRQAVISKVWQSSQKAFAASERARSYAASRGLDWQAVQPGFIGEKFGSSWNKQLKENAAAYGVLKKSKDGRYIPQLKDCLLFPLKDKEGKPVSFYGRSIIENADSHHGSGRHFYLKDRKGLYPEYPEPETRRLILTESVIDAATLLQNEEINQAYTILALFGTNGLTEEHLEAIKALVELEEIIFFLDGDEAGRKSTQKHAATLKALLLPRQSSGQAPIKISSVNTPEGEDINSLLESHEPAILTHLLNERLSFSIERTTESNEKKSPEASFQIEAQPRERLPQERLPLIKEQGKLTFTTSIALYQVLGGVPKQLDNLKISLAIESLQSGRKSRSKLDLYEDRQVERVAKEAAEKLNLRADLLQLDLEQLTDLLEEYRENQEKETTKVKTKLSAAIEAKCISFLQKADLLERLNELIGKAGVVGEEQNRLFLLGIAASYKMPQPLHALIQGSSGSGKTHLLSKISQFIPDEDKKHFTRVTESSFYNYGMYDLQNKLICLEDLDGMKEEAFLAFRELQSKGEISSSTSGKDEQGNIRAYEKVVYGPIASLACTTKGEIYEDNMSRCFLVAVDETEEQTQRVIQYQNRKAAGKIDVSQEKEAATFMQHCIRMLKPYPVINPYADKVNLPKEAHKIRRLNELYQCYVKQITLLHQYQRQTDKQGRLISQKEDLQHAAELMFESILLKVDELNGSLRQFYEELKSYIRTKGYEQSYQFGQREIRQTLKISKTQLQRYIYELQRLEYIQQAGGYGNRGYQYKIIYWDSHQALRAKVKKELQIQLNQLELKVA
jgi:DNA primase